MQRYLKDISLKNMSKTFERNERHNSTKEKHSFQRKIALKEKQLLLIYSHYKPCGMETALSPIIKSLSYNLRFRESLRILLLRLEPFPFVSIMIVWWVHNLKTKQHFEVCSVFLHRKLESSKCTPIFFLFQSWIKCWKKKGFKAKVVSVFCVKEPFNCL